MYEVQINYVKSSPEDEQRQERLVKLLGTALERFLKAKSTPDQAGDGLDFTRTISVTTHDQEPGPGEDS